VFVIDEKGNSLRMVCAVPHGTRGDVARREIANDHPR
jgi:hypothetical protein